MDCGSVMIRAAMMLIWKMIHKTIKTIIKRMLIMALIS